MRRVFRLLTTPLDRLALWSARSGQADHGGCSHAAEAQKLLEGADFFCSGIAAPAKAHFTNEHDFSFNSPLATPWAENNVVPGKLHRAGKAWREKPAVILIHGWNGELGYRWQFPLLARRLARRGVNAAMIELPYHGRRKPRRPDAINNFISHDLLRMVEATRQAIADTRALAAWLAAQGSPRVGLWGFSMGAWLAGLVAGHDPQAVFAVLLTPIARLDRAIAELAFCEPIRQSLQNTAIRFEPLNLRAHFPLAGPENILLLESTHDLFAPADTVEELWRAWRKPEIWRLPHGHISVLLSLRIMERAVDWVVRHATPRASRLAI